MAKQNLSKIINAATNRTVIVPMDHAVSLGPIKGLLDMPRIINEVARGGADAVLLHKGIIKSCFKLYGKIGLILHLSASTALSPNPNNKVIVASIEEAKELKADMVSVHINIGTENEANMLKDLGNIAKACSESEIPLFAMMFPRGKKIKSEYDVEIVKHVTRIGAELGADIIKTNYTGSPESFKQVVKGCPVPVVIAGGPKIGTTRQVLQMVREAIDAGAAGVSIGRNIFQAQNPRNMVKAIVKLVHEDSSVEKAMRILK